MATIESFGEVTAIDDGSDYVLLSRGGVYQKVQPRYLTGGLVKVVLTITPAQMFTGNTTPITLLAAQGAGSLIEPLSIMCNLQYVSATYATATKIRVHHAGQVNYMKTTSASFVTSAIARREAMLADNSAAANFTLHGNAALVVSLDFNAITGDSPVLISALLRVGTF